MTGDRVQGSALAGHALGIPKAALVVIPASAVDEAASIGAEGCERDETLRLAALPAQGAETVLRVLNLDKPN